jgi:hypothetical protein
MPRRNPKKISALQEDTVKRNHRQSRMFEN